MKKTAFRKNAFEHFASKAIHITGSTPAFVSACSIVLLWLIAGPLFGYSDTWQLVINTGTTIITFLMVFLIQKTQNKDSIVIQIKLNELVAAEPMASNMIINVEELTEQELHVLHHYYAELARMTKKETDIRRSHSIEEAREKHHVKMKLSTPQKERIPINTFMGKRKNKVKKTNGASAEKNAGKGI